MRYISIAIVLAVAGNIMSEQPWINDCQKWGVFTCEPGWKGDNQLLVFGIGNGQTESEAEQIASLNAKENLFLLVAKTEIENISLSDFLEKIDRTAEVWQKRVKLKSDKTFECRILRLYQHKNLKGEMSRLKLKKW